ncbi:pentapeptide repeat-containing protein [Actinomadura alba]|uniref:Pentapeptide repeat-containing protein n=2 Tax=Actinomadura alba TaxID=406431 RepID=A0ABR7LQ73_9ACTN|nr:pentapeptide repeat-containing protein [Actinomadura alba]
MVRDMALASDPVTQDELNDLAAGHRRWLETGGGGGTWQVLKVGSLPLAIYNGPSGAEGTRAELRYRRFEKGADLRGLVLSWADLTGLVGEWIDLRGADLRNATVTDAQLRGAQLSGADLSGADFSRADLSGADLMGADLTGTDFENTDLTDAKRI